MSDHSLDSILEVILDDQLSTLEFYFERMPALIASRRALHESILRTVIGAKSFSRNRNVYILGGAPANGKSTFLESRFCNYPANALKIDADEIKSSLPEYPLLLSRKEPLAAVIVHEESSVLAKKIREAAIKKGIDLILDGIADDTLQRRKDEYENFKNNGYFVKMDYVSLETTLSLELAEGRAEKTGRRVPEAFLIAMNAAIARLIPAMIEHPCFDELSLWDTNEEDNPRLILRHKNGTLEMQNKSLYENFKNKADE